MQYITVVMCMFLYMQSDICQHSAKIEDGRISCT